MKKVLALILVLLSALVLVVPAYADESEIKDLYPYNDPLVLTGESQFNTNVGDSHWDVVFNGARYHIVRGNVRYLGLIEDANANGDIDLTEVPTLEWGSFGSL